MSRRFITDLTQRFEWNAPSLPSGAPTLSVPDLGIDAQALTVVTAARTITAVNNTQDELTVDAAIGAGLTGAGFPVLVDLGSQGRFIRIIESVINDTTVRLASPLGLTQRVAIDPGASAMSLNWLTYGVEIAAATWGEDVQRTMAWSVNWTEDRGDAPAMPRRPARGLLDVVHQVPDTGLTHADLVAVYPHLGKLCPIGHADLSPAIARAQTKLEGWVAQEMPTSRFVDQIDFSQWHEVHVELTAAVVLRDWMMTQRRGDDGTAAQIQEHETQAGKAFSRNKRLRWVDANDDGLRGAGEADVAPVANRVTVTISTDVAADPTDEFDVRNRAELFY